MGLTLEERRTRQQSYTLKYRLSNPDKVKASRSNWQKRNSAALNKKKRDDRAAKLKAVKGKCQECKGKIKRTRAYQKFCKPECRWKATKKRQAEKAKLTLPIHHKMPVATPPRIELAEPMPAYAKRLRSNPF